ncbi:MAG: putative TIM-barrel enzyme, partial [Patescibacteria group bacterium]
EGIQRADAIVTTGEGTGLETPLQKLIDFRKASDEFPLIVGAGITKENISEQLRYANGAIIGSYFKQDGEITQVVDSKRVSRLMSIVRSI